MESTFVSPKRLKSKDPLPNSSQEPLFFSETSCVAWVFGGFLERRTHFPLEKRVVPLAFLGLGEERHAASAKLLGSGKNQSRADWAEKDPMAKKLGSGGMKSLVLQRPLCKKWFINLISTKKLKSKDPTQ